MRVVSSAAVRNTRLKEHHFTISEAGVTQFRKLDKYRTDAQFTPLVAWRHEGLLFGKVMELL